MATASEFLDAPEASPNAASFLDEGASSQSAASFLDAPDVATPQNEQQQQALDTTRQVIDAATGPGSIASGNDLLRIDPSEALNATSQVIEGATGPGSIAQGNELMRVDAPPEQPSITPSPTLLGELAQGIKDYRLKETVQHFKKAGSIAYEELRRPFSPILGPTEAERIEKSIPFGHDAAGNPIYEYKPLGDRMAREAGLMTSYIPFRPFVSEKGDSATEAALKAAANTAQGIAGSILSPAGVMIPAASVLPGAGRAIAGVFAADMATHLPGQIEQAFTGDTTQQKIEGALGALSTIAFGYLGARHAAGHVPDMPIEQLKEYTRTEMQKLQPEGQPAFTQYQQIQPETLDGLHLAKEKLKQGFSDQTKEEQANRQELIDSIDNQLLRASREDVNASAERVRERAQSPSPAEAPASPVSPESPPAEGGISNTSEQARISNDAGNSYAERTTKIESEDRRATTEERAKTEQEKKAFREGLSLGDIITVEGETVDHNGVKSKTTSKYKVAEEGGRLVADLLEGPGSKSFGLEPDSSIHFFNALSSQVEGGQIVNRKVSVEKPSIKNEAPPTPTEQRPTEAAPETQQLGESGAPVEGTVPSGVSPELIRTYQDHAERIADQVTQGQPTIVREAARDAALNNAMSSVQGGKTPNYNFMRKAARTAASDAMKKQGESLEGGERPLAETIPAEQRVTNEELYKPLNDVIESTLSERDAAIVRGVQERSMEDVAAEHGLSKQRVSQIVRDSLPKLRRALEEKGFTKDDYVGGPGAMGPVEALEMKMKEEFTGTKNARVEEERIRRGEEPLLKEEPISNIQSIAKARETLASDPNRADVLVQELNNSNRDVRTISTANQAILMAHKIDLMNQRRIQEDIYQDGTKSPEEHAVAAQKLNEIEQKMNAVDQATHAMGSEGGRFMQLRQRLLRADYSLEAMERRARIQKGEALTTEERTKIAEQSAKIKELQDKLDEVQKANVEKDATKAMDETVSELKKQAEASTSPESKFSPKVLALAESIVSRIDKAADSARQRIRERLKNANAAVDPTVIYDVAVIGLSKLARSSLDFAKWAAEMRKDPDLGEWVEPHLEEAWKETNRLWKEEEKKLTPSDRPKVNQVRAKKGDLAGQQTAIDAALKARATAGDAPADVQSLVQRLALNFVRGGITDRNALIDAVHGVLQKSFKDITKPQTRDLISGYGEFKTLDKEQAKTTLRGLKGEMQQISKIEEMQRGQAPRKTGIERREPTAEERRLIKEVNELKKRGGFQVTDPATQLKTAQDAIKTRLTNEIRDLDTAIATKEPIPNKKGTVEYDAEMKALREQRDAKKAQYDELFPKEPLTDAQMIERMGRTLDRNISELEQQLKEGRLYPEKTSRRLTSPEVDAKRARLEALRNERQTLRDLDTATVEAAKEKRLLDAIDKANAAVPEPKEGAPTVDTQRVAELKRTLEEAREARASSPEAQQRKIEAATDAIRKSIAEYDRRLREGDTSPRTQKGPMRSDELDALRNERDALERAYREMVQESKPTKTFEQRQIESLEARKAELLDKISRKDTSSPARRSTVDTQEVAQIRAEVDALNKQLAELRKAERPRKPEEQKQLESLERRIAEVKDKIAKGDISTPGRKATVDTQQVAAARVELQRLNEQMDLLRYGPPKTADEIALQAYKTRTTNRIAEMQERIANKDFEPKPKGEVKMDPEALKLKFQIEKVQEQFNDQLVRYRHAQKNLFQKTLSHAADTAGLQRALFTGFDLSAILNQGGFITFGSPFNPKQLFNSLKAMVSGIKSEQGKFNTMEGIRNRERYHIYEKAKLYISDSKRGSLHKSEEAFMSRFLQKMELSATEGLKGTALRAAQRTVNALLSPIRASDRAYSTFLNQLRVETFDQMANAFEAKNGHLPLEEARSIANYVNNATGRGSFGKFEQAGQLLSTTFFSPRFVISRFGLLTGEPIRNATPATRALIAKQYGKYLAGVATFYALGVAAGGKVETDPRSSDFGKLIIGNTRLDPTVGLSQALVFLARTLTGETKSTKTGKVSALRSNDRPLDWLRERGLMKPIDQKYNPKNPLQRDTGDVIVQFARSKAAPVVGALYSGLKGKDFMGNPTTMRKELQSILFPMSIDASISTMKKNGIPEGTALTILQLLGLRVNQYDDKINRNQ